MLTLRSVISGRKRFLSWVIGLVLTVSRLTQKRFEQWLIEKFQRMSMVFVHFLG
jgi:hypothetical protein